VSILHCGTCSFLVPQPLLTFDVFLARANRGQAGLAVSASLDKAMTMQQEGLRAHEVKCSNAQDNYPKGSELKATHASIKVHLYKESGPSGGQARGVPPVGFMGIAAVLFEIDTEHDVRNMRKMFSTAAACTLPLAIFEKEADMQQYKILTDLTKKEIGIRRMICLDSLPALRDASLPTKPKGYLGPATDFLWWVYRRNRAQIVF